MDYEIKWRDQPSQAWLRCNKISTDIEQFAAFDELVVHLEIGGSKYIAFVPQEFVDLEKQLIDALIVADYGDDILVDIPVETMTSGPRFRIPHSEMSILVTA